MAVARVETIERFVGGFELDAVVFAEEEEIGGVRGDVEKFGAEKTETKYRRGPGKPSGEGFSGSFESKMKIDARGAEGGDAGRDDGVRDEIAVFGDEIVHEWVRVFDGASRVLVDGTLFDFLKHAS